MTDPKDVGRRVENSRGKYELLLKEDVDNHVSRLAWTPKIVRDGGPPWLHMVFDLEGMPCQIIILRKWELEYLKNSLPSFIETDDRVFTVGNHSYPVVPAIKELQDTSRAPYVYDATLPQHRLNNGEKPRPLQDEYPVWYFLVGDAGRSRILQALLKLDKAPHSYPATVHGLSTIETDDFECSYEAELGHGSHFDSSQGTAYLVSNKLAEQRLRYFKTNFSKVIRCKINLHVHGYTREVNSLTFAFRGGLKAITDMSYAAGLLVSGEADIQQVSCAFASSIIPVPEQQTANSARRGPSGEEESDSEEETSAHLSEDMRPKAPLLKGDRIKPKGTGLETLRRRLQLRSPSRPKSPLVFLTEVSDINSVPELVSGATKDAYTSEPSKDSRLRRNGKKIAFKKEKMERDNWWVQPLEITTRTSGIKLLQGDTRPPSPTEPHSDHVSSGRSASLSDIVTTNSTAAQPVSLAKNTLLEESGTANEPPPISISQSVKPIAATTNSSSYEAISELPLNNSRRTGGSSVGMRDSKHDVVDEQGHKRQEKS